VRKINLEVPRMCVLRNLSAMTLKVVHHGLYDVGVTDIIKVHLVMKKFLREQSNQWD